MRKNKEEMTWEQAEKKIAENMNFKNEFRIHSRIAIIAMTIILAIGAVFVLQKLC